MRLDIKPLSVNKAWKGRRMKTDEYLVYEKTVYYTLPTTIEIPVGKLHLIIHWGFSSKGSDVDNCVKPFIDILQKKYGFNDNRIYCLVLIKEEVKKGDEFIDFELDSYE